MDFKKLLNVGEEIAFRGSDGRVCKKATVVGWCENWLKVEVTASQLIQYVNTDWLTTIQPLDQDNSTDGL